MYVTDENGKWEDYGSYKILPAGNESESYIAQRELEKLQIQEQELINSLIPSEKEILMAEIENNILNLLMEVEII